MEAYLRSVLSLVSKVAESDAILQCQCEHQNDISAHYDELLQVADQKLHVFPYKEVKTCWFRLYTDASIIKAVKLILTHCQDADKTPVWEDQEWADEVVGLLDMALIMAGGLGREDVIQELLKRLQLYLRDRVHDSPRPVKRRRFNQPSEDHGETRTDCLPSSSTSIPKLKFPVKTIHQPPLDRFQKHMTDRAGPIVLTGTLDHWTALEHWPKLRYWYDQTMDGRRLVPVELGRSYVDDGWGQKIMSFGDFLADHVLSTAQENLRKEIQTGYLAQHNILKQIPSLYEAIATPDYCYLEGPPPEPHTPVALSKVKSQNSSHPMMIPASGMASSATSEDDSSEVSDVQANIWFGPAWTISPLHHDPYHNILCHVVGKKYVRLYSPHDSSKLYPRSAKEPTPDVKGEQGHDAATIDMSNTSSIDISAIELSPDEDWDAVYPGISDIPYVECVLEAGQALYIPIGWWHYVRSCSVGISVSFWW